MPYVKARDYKQMQDELKRLRSQSDSPDFSGLKETIKNDTFKVGMNDVGRLLMQEVAIKLNCRHDAVVMEQPGKTVRVQPFMLTDSVYNVVSQSTLKRIMKETQGDRIKYQSEEYDCEDFARRFVQSCVDLGVNSVGRVLSASARHAFNIGIVHQNKKRLTVVFIEPQADTFVEAGKRGYEMNDALMVIS